jgi:hypothetical protein
MARLMLKLASDRLARDAARERFDEKLKQVREDLGARGAGGRILDRVTEDARDMFDEALDVADENRGVIAGTIAALMIWFFRSPIIAAAERTIGALSNKESGK